MLKKLHRLVKASSARIRLTSYGLILVLNCFLFSSCAGDPLFVAIGNNLSGPISIVIDAANNRAYVVNSNLNVAFDDATLLTLDISNPEQPVILNHPNNPISIPSLSGEAFLDTANQQLLVTNRLSNNKNDIIDELLRINVNEAGSFGTTEEFSSGENPFGIACCDASNNFYVVSDGTLESFELNDPNNNVTQSLEVTLQNGNVVKGDSTTHIAILGQQAFLSNRAGIIYVINLDKATDTSLNPIDYLITDMEELRAITTDGNNIYVTEADFNDDDVHRLRVINPETVPPIAENSEAITEIDIEDTRTINDTDINVQQETLSLDKDSNAMLVYLDKLYVASEEENSLKIFDLSNPGDISEATELNLGSGTLSGQGPFALTAANLGGTDYLYVGNLDSNNILIINLNTQSIVASFP